MASKQAPSIRRAVHIGSVDGEVRAQFCSPTIVKAFSFCRCDYVYIDRKSSPNGLMSALATGLQ
jgi:hypothetical protein